MAIAKARYPCVPIDPRFPTCDHCINGAFEVRMIANNHEHGFHLHCNRCGVKLKGGLGTIGIKSENRPKIQEGRMFKPEDKDFVLRRDLVRCFRCGCGPEESPLEIDHIVPFAAGGPSLRENAVTLCQSCNTAKAVLGDPFLILMALAHAHRSKEVPEGVKGAEDLIRRVCKSLKAWGIVKPT